MELSKNLYINNQDDDGDDVYVRIKHFDWQRYNDNAKRIKIIKNENIILLMFLPFFNFICYPPFFIYCKHYLYLTI